MGQLWSINTCLGFKSEYAHHLGRHGTSSAAFRKSLSSRVGFRDWGSIAPLSVEGGVGGVGLAVLAADSFNDSFSEGPAKRVPAGEDRPVRS